MADTSRRAQWRHPLMLFAVLMAMVLSAEWYYGTLYRDYSFPDRYEDAFGGILRALLFGSVVGMIGSTRMWKQGRDRS